MPLQSSRHLQLAKGLPIALVVLFVAGIVLACFEVNAVIVAAKPQSPVLFDHGLTTPRIAAPKKWTNQWCGTCHKQEFAQWEESRHAASGITENFIVEFLDPKDGHRQFCINCHTPTTPADFKLPTFRPTGMSAAFESRQTWVENGVGCLTCHVRDGHILATRVTEKAKQNHPMRLAPELASAEFCGGCHQFGFKEHDLPDSFRGALQQASFEEFLDFRKAGGGVDRCQDCHMIDGDHHMPGGYSDEMLDQSVDLEIEPLWLAESKSLQVTVLVSAGHVGHRIPGGEHFRFLSFETRVTDSAGNPITVGRAATKDGTLIESLPHVVSLRRELGDFESEVDLEAEPIPDQRLRPDETRRTVLVIPVDDRHFGEELSVSVDLRYHLMSNEKAARFQHSTEEIVRSIESTSRKVKLGSTAVP